MGCRHRNGVGYRWEADGWQPVTQLVEVDLRRCTWFGRVTCDCGAWLPLGESNDSGEHAKAVAIEIRAAEIAVNVSEEGLTRWAHRNYEWYGWLAFQNTPTDAYGLRGDEAGFGSGWLARAISTNEEGAGMTLGHNCTEFGCRECARFYAEMEGRALGEFQRRGVEAAAIKKALTCLSHNLAWAASLCEAFDLGESHEFSVQYREVPGFFPGHALEGR